MECTDMTVRRNHSPIIENRENIHKSDHPSIRVLQLQNGESADQYRNDQRAYSKDSE